MPKLILASTSPYRKELLERLGLPFETRASDVDEDSFKDKIKDPTQLTEALAKAKAQTVLKDCDDNQNALVIGGDQVSLFQNQILGKPHTPEEAFDQLKKLQGLEHQLVTATCLMGKNIEVVWTEVMTMKMRALSDDEIRRYIEVDKPLDCAGSYKIEGLGISLFEKISGDDHTSIIGLPLISLSEKLRQQGLNIP